MPFNYAAVIEPVIDPSRCACCPIHTDIRQSFICPQYPFVAADNNTESGSANQKSRHSRCAIIP